MNSSQLQNYTDLSAQIELPERAEIAAAVDCPIPLTLNPRLDRAEQQSLEWLGKYGLMDRLGLTKAAKAHLTTLVAGFYPTAAFEELSLASDYVSWAFALDDIGDETHVGVPTVHESMVRAVLPGRSQ